MNDKKQNLNSENNGHAGRTDQAEADRFVEALETDPRAVGSLDRESRAIADFGADIRGAVEICLLYTSPSPRDRQKSRMPSSA